MTFFLNFNNNNSIHNRRIPVIFYSFPKFQDDISFRGNVVTEL